MKKWMLTPTILLLLFISACGNTGNGKQGTGGKATTVDTTTVRLGILKNVTHAPGIVALEKGYFQEQFGQNVTIEVLAFDNGSDFAIALATNKIDLGYAGPGPLTNQFLKSENFKVISGSNNGGATLVVRKDANIQSVSDLNSKVIATPTKGSTPELSLRLLLKQEGLKVTSDTSGVQLLSRSPADVLTAIRQGEIDGALIHEPWGSQIVEEGIGSVLVDWDKIPPNNGDYPLTVLAASDSFLADHRDLAKRAIAANAEGIRFIKETPDEAYQIVADQLKEWSGSTLNLKLIQSTFGHLKLTDELNTDAFKELADVSIDAGYIKNVTKKDLDLSSMFDLSLLKEVKQATTNK
ncbi:MAG: ABC transporter substrate-binding protein [Paenibacillus sp.]|nr:ABC transporter substrate-binding protein [Paenibacillus sp.]